MSNSNDENPVRKFKESLSKASESLPSLKGAIKTSVDKTNSILSTLEAKKYHIDQSVDGFVSSRLRPLMTRISSQVSRAYVIYQKREYYGPQIVAGSAAAMSSLVYLRRGRVPAFFTGTVTGAGAYTGIYGLPKFIP